MNAYEVLRDLLYLKTEIDCEDVNNMLKSLQSKGYSLSPTSVPTVIQSNLS